MGRMEDRMETLRKDCSDCSGKGFTGSGDSEVLCAICGGNGQIEKEVPFKYDGARTKEEVDEVFNEN